jgi:hypothetical protein
MSGFSQLDVRLPTGFSQDKIDDYISELKSFLSSPLVDSLILAHPNEIAIPKDLVSSDSVSRSDWWSWAGNIALDYRQVVVEGLINSAGAKDTPKGMSFLSPTWIDSN